MRLQILSFQSSIPTSASLNPFKQQSPIRHFPDHHNRHNSSKITIRITIKALNYRILTPTNGFTWKSSLANKTLITPEEIQGSTTKTIQTTQVATTTITSITISETKAFTKTNLSSMSPSSITSNHNKTIPLNKHLTRQQVNHGNKMQI